MIDEFKHDNRFLSNFSPSKIKIEGHAYPTVEHAYQAGKTKDHKEQAKIRKEPSPFKAKRLGRQVKLRKNWEKSKDSFMYKLLELKFKDPLLREWLLATKGHELIEGNYWHDNYWGVCYCSRCKDKPGVNTLGKLLMILRDEITNENPK